MDLFSIAISNVRRRRGRIFFLVVGLVVSAATALTLITLGRGMSSDIARRLDEYGANILVLPAAQGLTLSYGGVTVQDASGEGRMLRELDIEGLKTIRNAENISIVAPKLVGKVDVGTRPVLTVGVRFDEEFRLKQWWRLGQGTRPEAGGDVLLGADVARTLALEPGDSMNLGTASVTVAGVLAATGDQDDGLIFTDLTFLQGLLGADGRLSMVEVAALCTGCPIEEMVAQISGALPGAQVRAMKETLDLKMRAVHQFHLFSYVVSGVIGLVAALIVFITMTAAVGERKREIGIFRSVGYRRGHIMRIICSEAFLVGLAGGTVGASIGMFLPRYLAPFVVQTQDVVVGFDPVAGGVTVLATACVATAASLYPALRAAKLDPVEALREL